MTIQPKIVEEFRKAFMNAVASRGKKRGMTRDELRSAESLASSLACLNDTDPPIVDALIANFVNESFAYGCAIFEGRLDPTEFVGGRQDGFEERYKIAKRRRTAQRAYNKKHAGRHGGGKNKPTTQKKPAVKAAQVTAHQPVKLTLVPRTSDQSTLPGTRSIRPGGKRARKAAQGRQLTNPRAEHDTAWGNSAS